MKKNAHLIGKVCRVLHPIRPPFWNGGELAEIMGVERATKGTPDSSIILDLQRGRHRVFCNMDDVQILPSLPE